LNTCNKTSQKTEDPKKTILTLVVALILLFPSLLTAQVPDDPEQNLEGCKLTQDQQDQIHQIRAANQKQVIDVRAALEKLEIDQREAMREEDYAKARKLVSKIYEKRAELEVLRIDMQEQISRILTDEQKQNWRHRRMMQAPDNRREGIERGMRQGPHQCMGGACHPGMAPDAMGCPGQGGGQPPMIPTPPPLPEQNDD